MPFILLNFTTNLHQLHSFSNNLFSLYEQSLAGVFTNMTFNVLLIKQLISSIEYVDIIVLSIDNRI